MANIRVKLTLPFALRLAEGDYQTTQGGEVISVAAGPLEETNPETIVSAVFDHPAEGLDTDQIQRLRARDADQLLRRTNRLLRWYRSIRRRADITELTRAQASPFVFEVSEGPIQTGWTESLEYEELGPTPAAMTLEELTAAVRLGLASGNEPEVDVLFLLDAERALQQGRFREAVLFCWSTIDSVFNRKFDLLADVATQGEWAEARKFFTGMDFGLRHKMSLGMRFVANRSLFNEPDEFWIKLSDSYKKRNKIIHEGETAVEDEARLAIHVARTLVNIMNSIPLIAGPAAAAPP